MSELQTIRPIIEEGIEEEDSLREEEESEEIDEEESLDLEECTSGELLVKLAKHRAQKEKEKQQKEDEGSDTDLELDEERADYDVSGKTAYISCCRNLGIVPASYFIRHMNDSNLSMAHHGLGSKGMRALAYPLMNNTNVVSLDLQDNWLEKEGGEYIARMLKENCYIVDLNLSDNKLGSRGCEAICKVLQNNTTLKHINLSGNELADRDSVCITEMLNENNILKTLNLSNNHFGDTTSTVLVNAISENETLEELDLSWNNYRLKSGFNVCQGIAMKYYEQLHSLQLELAASNKKVYQGNVKIKLDPPRANSRLRVVHLAMNGLGNEGAFGIAEILKITGTITELDVSNNRIGLPGATLIGKALEKNDLLRILNIGYNPLGVDGSKLLLKGLSTEINCVKELDLSGIEVDKEFRTLKKQLQETRDIVIRHGPVLSDYVIVPKPKKKPNTSKLFGTPMNEITTGNVMAVIKAYCEDGVFELYETLLVYDKHRDKRVTWADFQSAIADTGIQLTAAETEQLENLLEEYKNSEGKIDFSALK